MKPVSILSCLFLALSLSACQRSATNESANAMTGSGRDSHGCLASAGETWSPVRIACIRVFETGLPFEPTADNPDQTMLAYVITTPVDGSKVKAAELHWPGEAAPWALDVVHTPEGDIRPTVLASKKYDVVIFRNRDNTYFLGRKDMLLFEFATKAPNPLDTITWKK
jgi:hypothetical protein